MYAFRKLLIKMKTVRSSILPGVSMYKLKNSSDYIDYTKLQSLLHLQLVSSHAKLSTSPLGITIYVFTQLGNFLPTAPRSLMMTIIMMICVIICTAFTELSDSLSICPLSPSLCLSDVSAVNHSRYYCILYTDIYYV